MTAPHESARSLVDRACAELATAREATERRIADATGPARDALRGRLRRLEHAASLLEQAREALGRE